MVARQNKAWDLYEPFLVRGPSFLTVVKTVQYSLLFLCGKLFLRTRVEPRLLFVPTLTFELDAFNETLNAGCLFVGASQYKLLFSGNYIHNPHIPDLSLPLSLSRYQMG